MHVLTCNIALGGYRFKAATSIEIDSSWKECGDRCRITLPRRAQLLGKAVLEAVKPGDAAVVECGWDGNAHATFKGVVHKVSPDTPLVIELEDGWRDLRRGSVSKTYSTTTLKQLLADILPAGLEVQADDIAMGRLRFDQVTPARVLLELQKTWGIYSWFRDGKLHCGLPYALAAGAEVRVDFQRNVVSSNLTAIDPSDRKVRIKAISLAPDGKATTVEAGDGEGDIRTLHYFDITKAELERIAKAEARRIRDIGWEGDVEVFGNASAKHGDVAVLVDASNPDRKGKYLIDAVATTWGEGGFRQRLTLGRRVANG